MMGKKTKIEFEERLAQIVAQGADATAEDCIVDD